MRTPSTNREHSPILKLPSVTASTINIPGLYTPSEQSPKDTIDLAVFDPEGQLDKESIYAESEKDDYSQQYASHLCGIIPYYILAYAAAIAVPLISLAIGLVLYFYLHNRGYSVFRDQVYIECSNRATVSLLLRCQANTSKLIFY
jgi:hypothetical protein